MFQNIKEKSYVGQLIVYFSNKISICTEKKLCMQ